jgi:hypothetical protein
MYFAMRRQMLISPPVNELVAAYLEYKPPADARPAEEEGNLGDLIKMFPGGEVA